MTTIIRAYDYYESKLGTTRRKGILIDKIFREKNMIFSVHLWNGPNFNFSLSPPIPKKIFFNPNLHHHFQIVNLTFDL